MYLLRHEQAKERNVHNMSNKTFDALKWVVMVVIPTLTTAYTGFAGIWGLPYAEEVAKTSAVVCTMLGALLGISTIQYNKKIDEGEENIGPFINRNISMRRLIFN